MDVWGEVIGQAEAIAQLRKASGLADSTALLELAEAGASVEDAVAHAWLITGPPGSGRSNLARAFATELLAHDAAELESIARQVRAGAHPDLVVLRTEKVIISIDDVRELVSAAAYAPSSGRHRVLIVEDADRMTERTSNVLLKSLEEPPERTVWILCAPSEADVLPTIRSRVRSLRLRTPSVEEVARLLSARDGIEEGLALRAARLAQSHVGMARRLASDPEALARREETIALAWNLESLPAAMQAAARLHELASEDAQAYTAERDAAEREELMRSLGLSAGATIPPALRAQLRQLEEDQKRRATRSLRDGIDRALTDLMSIHRDVLLCQLGAPAEPINAEHAERIEQAAAASSPEQTLRALDAIARAQQRLASNVSPLLVLEAMLTSLLFLGRREAAR